MKTLVQNRRLVQRLAVLVVLFLCHIAGSSIFPAQAADSKDSYLQRLQRRVGQWRGEIGPLRASASQAAQRVIGGGNLYAFGPQAGFASEVLGRSGGLILIKSYTAKTELTNKDTILAGLDRETTDASLTELLEKARNSGAHVVLFSGVTQNPASTGDLRIFPARYAEDRPANGLSTGSVNNVIGVWTWIAEFVGSCVAQGKMPCMYESIGMPNGRERDAPFRGKTFHEATDVAPGAGRNLGIRYLDAVSTALKKTLNENGTAFTRAALLMRQAHAAGGTVRTYYLGHMFPAAITGAPSPDWFTLGSIVLPPSTPPTEPASVEGLTSKDVVFVLGYQSFPWAMQENVQKSGAAWVVTSSHLPLAEFTRGARNVYINPFWEMPDAVLTLPGYDIPILPISGVMQNGIYWQLVESATAK